MPDLLDLLRELDPVPLGAQYDDTVATRNIDAIVGRTRALSVSSPSANPAIAIGERVRERPVGRHRRRLALGIVTVAGVLVIAFVVAVALGWRQPLVGTNAAANARAAFPADIDPSTVSPQVSVTTEQGVLTLWSGSSPALGQCLVLVSRTDVWHAATGVERAWRSDGAASCLDNRVGDYPEGAGRSARFASPDGEQVVYAAGVTTPSPPEVVNDKGVERTVTPDNGPTSGVVVAGRTEVAGAASQPAVVDHGWLVTAPQAVNSCVTVVTSNGSGRALSSTVVTPNCSGAFTPPAAAAAGSPEPPIVANNWNYDDGLLVGFSALTRRPAELAATDDPDVTLVTLSVQFVDQCRSTSDGSFGWNDPCQRTPIALPENITLTLNYGANQVAAPVDPGRPGPDNDLANRSTPGYVGGSPQMGFLVYASFDVPTDQLTQLTAHWAGDSVHAPRVMPGLERGLR